MHLHPRERTALAAIFLLSCWADAPNKRHTDAAADAVDDSEVDLPDLDAAAGVPGRERGRAGGLTDAAPDQEAHAEAGTGALCGVNGRNDCGAFEVCDPVLGCVACARDDDCPLAEPRCVNGACGACADASDCPAATPACWPSDHACHAACDDARPCPAGAKICASGVCVGCAGDADCPGRVCAPASRQCVDCTSDEGCGRATPRCDVRRGVCVACSSNDDCGLAEPVCDPVTRTCRVGCESERECPGKHCDLAAGECVSAPTDASTD